MRILFLQHFPLGHAAAGRWSQHWAAALAGAGHEVRLLLVDEQPSQGDPLAVDRVVCSPRDSVADLSFALPHFIGDSQNALRATFSQLSDLQISAYREQIRKRLDFQIDRFNPDLIHAQHIWLQGQLALETGVPYVLNAWGPELAEYAIDPRFRWLADQAAENASCILVTDAELAREVAALFPSASERTLIMPEAVRDCDESPAKTTEGLNILLSTYRNVLNERFGHPG